MLQAYTDEPQGLAAESRGQDRRLLVGLPKLVNGQMGNEHYSPWHIVCRLAREWLGATQSQEEDVNHATNQQYESLWPNSSPSARALRVGPRSCRCDVSDKSFLYNLRQAIK